MISSISHAWIILVDKRFSFSRARSLPDLKFNGTEEIHVHGTKQTEFHPLLVIDSRKRSKSSVSNTFLVFQMWYLSVSMLQKLAKIRIYLNPYASARCVFCYSLYVLNEFLTAEPTVLVQQKMFGKTLIQFLVHTFTLLLAPFASKLVNYLRHCEFENRCFWRKMSSILEFSLC